MLLIGIVIGIIIGFRIKGTETKYKKEPDASYKIYKKLIHEGSI